MAFWPERMAGLLAKHRFGIVATGEFFSVVEIARQTFVWTGSKRGGFFKANTD